MQRNAEEEEEEEEGCLCLLHRNAELQRCREREQHQQHSFMITIMNIPQNCGSCSMPTGQKLAMLIRCANSVEWEELPQGQHGVIAVPDVCINDVTCYT